MHSINQCSVTLVDSCNREFHVVQKYNGGTAPKLNGVSWSICASTHRWLSHVDPFCLFYTHELNSLQVPCGFIPILPRLKTRKRNEVTIDS